MRVLQLCSLYGDKFFTTLMIAIESNNIDNVIFYPRRHDKIFETDKKNVISTSVYNRLDGIMYYTKILKILNSLKKNVSLDDIDLVHAHTLYSDGIVAYYLNRKYRIPYIVAVRSTDLNYYYKYRKDLYFMAKKILKNAKSIVFLSDSYLIKTQQFYRLNLENKSSVIPNGINEFFIENLAEKSNRIKKKNLEVLTVGFISRRKNQISVAKAIDLLNKKYNYKIKYNIVGKILHKKTYSELIKYDFVSYYNFMDKRDLVEMYRKMDIFALPSISETFGLTYLEAISQNLPVIYTKNEGFDGQFPVGKIGYPVESKNIEDIAEKIMIIANNFDNFKNISSLIKPYHWEVISLKYKKIYEDSLL